MPVDRVNLEDVYIEHSSRHAALATAVRVLIELEGIERLGVLSPSLEIKRERMQEECDKWRGTDDVYALGIMAPLKALGRA